MAALTAAIKSGELAPGDKLPTLKAPSEPHGVSYGTAQLAVAQLREVGLAQENAIVAPLFSVLNRHWRGLLSGRQSKSHSNRSPHKAESPGQILSDLGLVPSLLGESNPRPTHYECVALAD